MLRLQVIYEDESSELVEIPLDRRFQDLRDYFKDTHGAPAKAVEILFRC